MGRLAIPRGSGSGPGIDDAAVPRDGIHVGQPGHADHGTNEPWHPNELGCQHLSQCRILERKAAWGWRRHLGTRRRRVGHRDPGQATTDNSGIQRPEMEGRGTTDRGEGMHRRAWSPPRSVDNFSRVDRWPASPSRGLNIRGQSHELHRSGGVSTNRGGQCPQSRPHSSRLPKHREGLFRRLGIEAFSYLPKKP